MVDEGRTNSFERLIAVAQSVDDALDAATRRGHGCHGCVVLTNEEIAVTRAALAHMRAIWQAALGGDQCDADP